MDVVSHFRLSHDPFKTGAERELTAGDGAPLDAEAARRFIATRTAVAGRPDLFSPASLDVLAAASRGRPAALRLLAGNAMFHAAFDGAARVEEAHARQAAATQDIWRDVPTVGSAMETADDTVSAGSIGAAMAPIATLGAAPFTVAPIAEGPAHIIAAEADELPPRRRGWWRNAPPLARLAIVVGLLLLSLPVIGYVVGLVKDERPATEESYLPEDEIVTADAEAPIGAEPELPPAAAPAPVATAEAGPPIDLTAQTVPPEVPPAERAVESEPPVVTGAGVTDSVEPAPESEAAPVEPEAEPEPAIAATPRVFVHYSAEQPGAAEAAALVADSLRAQGFAVADIRAVPVRIDTASVRYFHAGDRATAEALHDAVGNALRGRGFSAGDLKSMAGYDPAPQRGTFEVWVPTDA